MASLCELHSDGQCLTHKLAVQNAFMSDESDRLIQARELAGYETATEAASAIGVNVQTYLAHENGHRGFGRNAKRYASFFRVSYAWLMTGAGTPKGRGGNTSELEEKFQMLDDKRKVEALRYLDFLRSLK